MTATLSWKKKKRKRRGENSERWNESSWFNKTSDEWQYSKCLPLHYKSNENKIYLSRLEDMNAYKLVLLCCRNWLNTTRINYNNEVQVYTQGYAVNSVRFIRIYLLIIYFYVTGFFHTITQFFWFSLWIPTHNVSCCYGNYELSSLTKKWQWRKKVSGTIYFRQR